ncbi:MAG: hypothetical protein ACTH5B_18810 [Marinomonas sp.]|uniref:hypothetical protein n=1 Tax=Marinomonas sp. TaxID=1904862 RepID=UPI003F957303
MNKRSKKELIFLLFLSLLIATLSPLLITYGYNGSSLLVSFVSIFVMFIIIVQYENDRLSKGVLLIFMGILFGYAYIEYVNKIIGLSDTNDLVKKDLIKKFKFISDFIIFSCAGAGGGVFAAYADQSSTDKNESIVSETVIDRTQDIRHLTDHILALNKKINTLIAVVSIIVIVMFFILIIR